jgi:hypothetical protein
MSLDSALAEKVYTRVMAIDPTRNDRYLPYWARRANPIIRHELGRFWRVLTPDFNVPIRWAVGQSAVLMATLPLPWLLNFFLPIIAVPVILLPAILYFYVDTLVRIGVQTAHSTSDEARFGRLTLLRVIPMPLRHTLYSKLAAALWRNIETLDLIILAAAILGLPVYIMIYANVFGLGAHPVEARLVMIFAYAASLLRLLLEPIMIGALGMMMGALTTNRISASASVIGTGAAYFIMINLPRLLPMSSASRILIEIALPLLLPIAITWLALHITQWALERE